MFLRKFSVTQLLKKRRHFSIWIFLFFFFFLFYLFIFFLICSEFCHTLKWNVLEFTCLPHPNATCQRTPSLCPHPAEGRGRGAAVIRLCSISWFTFSFPSCTGRTRQPDMTRSLPEDDSPHSSIPSLNSYYTYCLYHTISTLLYTVLFSNCLHHTI